MGRAKVDYDQLEREYINSPDVTFRDLETKYGVSFGSIAMQGRKRKWAEKREDQRRRVNEKLMERDSKRFVDNLEDLQYEQIQALRAIIFAGLQAIQDGKAVPQPRDITFAVEKLQLLVGKPTDRTEATVVGSNTTIGPDPELLRRLEEFTRGLTDVAPSASRLRIEGSKPN